MGCDSNLELPCDVRAGQFAKVLGIVAGLPFKLEPLGESGIAIRVDGAEAEPTGIEGMTEVTLQAPKGMSLVDGEEHHSCTFHYSSRTDDRKGICSCVIGRSTPFWGAALEKAARWFGGRVVYNDCGSGRGNSKTFKRGCPTDKHGLVPDDGEAWNEYHRRLAKMADVSEEDMRRVAKRTAYKDLVPA